VPTLVDAKLPTEDLVSDPEFISSAIDRTLSFIEVNGIDTYDPFDVTGTDIFKRLLNKRTPLTFVLRQPLWLGARYTPLLLRRLLKTPKRAAASGVANLAMAYTALGGRDNLAKARLQLQRLLGMAALEKDYMGWGFPFGKDLWNRKELPAGAPIGHTTMTCANALLCFYEATGEDWCLHALFSGCEFFDRGLNKTIRKSGSIAISYTPMDNSQVLNIQADVGSLLFRVGRRFDRVDFESFALKLIDCVLENQNEDGSWYYFAEDSVGKPSFIDNHHTGMVLTALVQMSAELAEGEPLKARIEKAITIGAGYFIEELFRSDGLPKYYNTKTYPLDIYNFAQAIITLIDLSNRATSKISHAAEGRLLQVARHLFTRMWKPGGGFLYQRTMIRKIDLGSLRWADALTCVALARYREWLSRRAGFQVEETHVSAAAGGTL
jgi:hypothetical protein